MRDLIIIGCGGFGREVHDVVDAINAIEPTWNLLGYADDDASPANTELVQRRGSTVLGPVDSVLASRAPAYFAVGIGAPKIRRRIDTRFQETGWQAATLIHPSATLGGDCHIGEGAIICAGARISTNVTFGRSVHINPNVTVGHDATLHNYVSVNPLVAISGWVEAHEGAMFGTHSSILQNLTVGKDALIGAAACVVKNVPPEVTVKGVPAR